MGDTLPAFTFNNEITCIALARDTALRTGRTWKQYCLVFEFNLAKWMGEAK